MRKISSKTRVYISVIAMILIIPVVVFMNFYFVALAISNFGENASSTATAPAPKGLIGNEVGVKIDSFSSQELTRLTNERRASEGKPALVLSESLNQSARAKCDDMVAENYWAHVSPTGKEPWAFFEGVGYSYQTAGENLAYGYASNTGVIDGWMNSPTHKANIVGSYTEIGFGVCESVNYQSFGHQIIIVQHFGTPKQMAPAKPQPAAYQPPVCTRTPVPYKTNYVDATYMYVGETTSYGGVDGYTETCTADSNGYRPADYNSQPYDKTVYVGTKPRPEASP